VDLSNELEKQFRFKTVERFGGKKVTHLKLSKKQNADCQERVDLAEVSFPTLELNGSNNAKEDYADPKIVQATVDSCILRILIIN